MKGEIVGQKQGENKKKTLPPVTQAPSPGRSLHPLLRLQQQIGNRAVLRMLSHASPAVQTKLRVNQSGDQYEQEADRVAEQVLRMPEPTAAESPTASLTFGASYPTTSDSASVIQRKCSCGGSCPQCMSAQPSHPDGIVQSKSAGTPASPSAATPSIAPPIVNTVLARSGQPLDPATQSFMEPRFGTDFAHVRIHTGPDAAESAKKIGARAYTVGGHIVFGEGEYSPASHAGRTLLTHELAHVVQQGSGTPPGMVQRREVDDRSCAGLTDIEPDVDNEVNHQIGLARTAATSATGTIDVQALAANVFQLLGQGVISPIETFVENMPATKRNRPASDLAGTKYQGTWFAHPIVGTSAGIVAASANVHNFCIGADKLGHFFDLGFRYFSASNLGATPDQIERLGRGSEMTIAGLGITGVYSNADLEANRKGLKFYKDLTAAPSSFTFAIKDYISDQWNEQANPSFYKADLGEIVWSNLLTGSWRGTRSISDTGASTDIQLDLTATASSVTGNYQWPVGATSPTKGTITAGQITQVTTAVTGDDPLATPPNPISDTPVSGVKIEFDWQRGTVSGKGVLTSANEQTLNGTWGYGASRNNGGALHLKKV